MSETICYYIGNAKFRTSESISSGEFSGDILEYDGVDYLYHQHDLKRALEKLSYIVVSRGLSECTDWFSSNDESDEYSLFSEYVDTCITSISEYIEKNMFNEHIVKFVNIYRDGDSVHISYSDEDSSNSNIFALFLRIQNIHGYFEVNLFSPTKAYGSTLKSGRFE
jgi:hypothetical protein